MTEWQDYTYRFIGGGAGVVAIGDTVSGGTTNSLLKVAAGPVLGQVACSADPGGAWTAYTPTLSANTGVFTSASAAGRYLQVGKLLFIQIAVTITTNGTAAVTVICTLPAGLVAASSQAFAGKEVNTSGFTAQAAVLSGTSNVIFSKYDGTYPGGNGNVLVCSGVIEVQ